MKTSNYIILYANGFVSSSFEQKGIEIKDGNRENDG